MVAIISSLFFCSCSLCFGIISFLCSYAYLLSIKFFSSEVIMHIIYALCLAMFLCVLSALCIYFIIMFLCMFSAFFAITSSLCLCTYFYNLGLVHPYVLVHAFLRIQSPLSSINAFFIDHTMFLEFHFYIITIFRI